MDDGRHIVIGLVWVAVLVGLWLLWPTINSFFTTTYEGLLG